MVALKVIFKDLKKGEIKLIPENLDDIWHLYNIIEDGDLIRAVTFRTGEQKDDKIRSKKAEKKRMKLGVRVEKIGFHEFSNRLRIHGTIEEGPQDLGSYHTLNVDSEKMDKLSIVKNEWKPHQLDRINEAVKQRLQPILIFVSMDEDKATVAILRQSGIQFITDIDSRRSGKMYESTEKEHEYYGEIISVIKTCKKKESPLVVVGSGFAREHFVKYGKTRMPELFENCISHGTGQPGINGIHETLKTGIVEQITKENRVSLETQFIEKLFEEIKKDGLAAYGLDEVTDALSKGAVERLLISDVLTRSENGEKLLQLARAAKSKFTIINTMHEAGKKFEGIGGVAALLRFKL
ncbi:MAG: mRNA surveillance protein pelota [Thermoplasmatales archaeon]|nr:MAG: mRNA surveillance protein pelota [Thermoplasmatales archaeon]